MATKKELGDVVCSTELAATQTQTKEQTRFGAKINLGLLSGQERQN